MYGKRNEHSKVTVIAPAKINLSLDITGTDERGYHLLDMLMQSVSIYEKITLTKQQRNVTISSNTRYIPTDSKNVAVKAALEFFKATGIRGGVHIYVKKTVPIKAGMAGGSADAAGVLVGLNKLYRTNLSRERLCEIGLKAGSDVPFMIVGGTKRVQGTGEIILPAPAMPKCYIVVCMPARGVSTPTAFSNYDSMTEKIPVDTEGLMAALSDGDLRRIAQKTANVLEPAAASPDTEPIKEKLINNGALGAVMTGSGARVFGIFDDENKRRLAAESFKGKIRSVFLAHPVPHGAIIINDRKRRNSADYTRG